MFERNETLTTVAVATQPTFRVMKFGGTSVATADGLLRLLELVEAALQEERVVLVASALAGVTDLLEAGLKGAVTGQRDAAAQAGRAFLARHVDLLKELEARRCPLEPERLRESLRRLAAKVQELLEGATLLRGCPPRSRAQLLSLGEQASCTLLEGLLLGRGLQPELLDPRVHLRCEGDPLEALPREGFLHASLARFRRDASLGIFPGFYGGDAEGAPVLLGRGGSDLSAALVAEALEARLLEIWTDVDGVFTADPRRVSRALPLPELSHEEAMELAYFGAKVLHPKTLAPLRRQGIPVRVCNSFRPEHPGTRVHGAAAPSRGPARGLSLLRKVALLDLAGPGMRTISGVAARAFAALASHDLHPVLITQGSSSCALSLCVRESDLPEAVQRLDAAFAAERAAGQVEAVEVRRDLCVLSLVGDGMRHRPGVSGAFFSVLGEARANIAAIAQGGSERSISAVLHEADAERAMEAVHDHFFLARRRLDLVLLGVGSVGRELLRQIARQQPLLAERGLDLRVCAVANSRQVLSDPRGMDADNALDQLELQPRTDPKDLSTLAAHLSSPVLVDCTAAETVAERYVDFLRAGFHVVSASKRLNAGPLLRYHRVREEAHRQRRHLLYEVNAGAGLPLFATLRSLQSAGDRVQRIEGVLSGSLSFLFGRLEDGMPFSQAVQEAGERGFTEPDPREDLACLDLARKALMLHRELGGSLELADVEVPELLPPGFAAGASPEEFLARLPELDAAMATRMEAARREGRVLRPLVEATATTCRVSLAALPLGHPLQPIRDGENAVSLLTEAYSPCPLVLRGYGAGPRVTALGVFGDVLRLAAELLP